MFYFTQCLIKTIAEGEAVAVAAATCARDRHVRPEVE